MTQVAPVVLSGFLFEINKTTMKTYHAHLFVRYKNRFIEAGLVGSSELISFIDTHCDSVDDGFEEIKKGGELAGFYSVSRNDTTATKPNHYYTNDLFVILNTIHKANEFYMI